MDIRWITTRGAQTGRRNRLRCAQDRVVATRGRGNESQRGDGWLCEKTTKKAHATLVQRLVEKAHILETEAHNTALAEQRFRDSYPTDYHSGSTSPPAGMPYQDRKSTHSGSGLYSDDQSVVSGGSHDRYSYTGNLSNPAYPDYSQRPNVKTSNSNPAVAPLGSQPSHPANFAVELPALKDSSPMELDSTRRHS